MNTQMRKKLAGFAAQADSLSSQLLHVDARSQSEQYKRLHREFSRVSDLDRLFQKWLTLERAQIQTRAHLNDSSADIRQLTAQELSETEVKLDKLESEIHRQLVPADENEGCSLFLEVRAGSGGSEAAIFCSDLVRMYKRFAENNRWTMETISCTATGQGGYREAVSRIEGRSAWSQLRYESGVHRVQRIPVTESQGRIHTSAASVAVLVEPNSPESVNIRPEDLRIDTFRASGAGGQHVNKTDSAVRITHLPTRTVVECQSGRSQHKNRASAMSLLHARILKDRQQQVEETQSQLRRSMIGSGDRSERIRTYNYPQGRVTDHRIGLTVHNLPEILDGNLNALVEAAHSQWQIEQIDAALKPSQS
ncbi:MAG: peptide chain release factor 1 [Gammaproteobacteria bacterium]|nr:peptide chain release factor 1 [Gammaproteobacteria bacterium]